VAIERFSHLAISPTRQGFGVNPIAKLLADKWRRM